MITYLDPEGLVWDGRKYVKNNFKSSGQKEFDIQGKEANKWIPADQFSDDLVQELYGCPFSGLPEEMQKGDKKAHIGLPADGTIWPVGRGYLNYRYVVGYDGRASRGVRPPQKISTRSQGAL